MDPQRLSVRIIAPASTSEIPEDLRSLRSEAYVGELAELEEASLFTAEDLRSDHLLLYHGDTVIGASALGPLNAYPRIESLLKGTNAKGLGSVWVDTRNVIHKDFRGHGLYHLLVYLGYSYLRAKGVDKTVALFPSGRSIVAATHYGAKACKGVLPATQAVPGGSSLSLVLHQMPEPGYICHKSYGFLPQALRAVLPTLAIAPNIEMHVKREIRRFHQSSFFRAVAEGMLTREQYIDALGNNLRYVQWTTRILAKMVGSTPDRVLRNHYLDHLKGEVDHDLLIERDLDYLGADLDYYRDHKVADPPIAQFMLAQEAFCEFRRDEKLFLAVPLTIEGFTAFLSSEFIDQLKALIASWGYSKPARGCRFLASHIATDGDREKGHWIRTSKVVSRCIATERQAAEFHTLINVVSDSLYRGFEGISQRPSLVA